MATNMSLGSQIIARELMVQRLLSNAFLVGGIYSMGFNECLILTNDLWKKQAGGIPQHCFLLATALRPGEAAEPEDEEVLLLRVQGPAPLAAETELLQVREEAMREMLERRGTSGAAAPTAIIDVLTRNEIQFAGLKAKVLGTFYDIDVAGSLLLAFGSDVETFYSASRYLVYKPYGDSLALIVSYPQVTEEEENLRRQSGKQAQRARIGAVRYSSSTRRRRDTQRKVSESLVSVNINVNDFVALKTAVFGMTRLGKSNTMKTIATAVAQYAAEKGGRIGQLLFDPAGEYANVNVQDRTALSQIGSEFVTIFRYGADGTQPGIRPLTTNFYSDDAIEVTWSTIRAYLSARKETADYVRSFLAADVIGPEDAADDRSTYNRARRRRAALYAILKKADFTIPRDFSTTVAVNAVVLSGINANRRPNISAAFQTDRHGNLRLSSGDLLSFWDAVIAAQDAGAQGLDEWVDESLNAILVVYRGSGRSGFRLLQPLRVYHSLARADDYAVEVLQELIAGKIVIIDLSLGTDTVLRYCSERIINHILEDAAKRFAAGEDMHQIQIFIEEAHKLFNRDRMNVPEEADPYVRLAKEAAKYKIGLIYATQEVSSVDPIILSNTSNWIVAHLNNTSEVRELAKYYDFEDFSELTLKAEDVGFVRLKTKSGRYIMPVQVDLFDETRIQQARQACQHAAQGAAGS